MARDTTGLPGYGHPITDIPTAVIRATRPVAGSSILTPIRPRRMSIREYRERYDTTPHTVVDWSPTTGEPRSIARCSGAVSAAVACHSRGAERLVTVYPEHLAPSREDIQHSRALDGEIVRVWHCDLCRGLLVQSAGAWRHRDAHEDETHAPMMCAR